MENISPGQIIDEPIRPVNIPRKEKDFQGMLEYKKEDEQKLVKNLILGKSFLSSVLSVLQARIKVPVSVVPGEASLAGLPTALF